MTPAQQAILRGDLYRIRNAATDPRYAKMVSELSRNQARVLLDYLNGTFPITGTYTHGKYTAVFGPVGEHHFMFMEGEHRPVPSGKWMGWPEGHWEIDPTTWNGMSLQEKAALEAEEQLTQYADDQFYLNLFNFYYHDEYSKFWWDAGWSYIGIRQRNQLSYKWLKQHGKIGEAAK